MKFNFNRLLSDSHSSVEEETIDRWRRAALKPGAPLIEDEVLDDLSWGEKFPQTHERTSRERASLELRSPVVRSSIPSRPEAVQFGSTQTSSRVAAPPAAHTATPRMIQKSSPSPSLSQSSAIAVQPVQVPLAQVPAQEPERTAKLLPGNPSFSIEEDMKQRFGARLRAALGNGTVIHGKLTFDTPVRIDGKLTGEVISSSTLVVGEAGNIKADVKVSSLVVYGKVVGPVHARDLVEIKNGGRLEGDITTQRLVIDEGGYFDGDCVIQIVN